MRHWWIAALVAFGFGVWLVMGHNPMQPRMAAVVGGGGGQETVTGAPRDMVGEAHLAAGRAQQALVREDQARALMAIEQARQALEAAEQAADGEAKGAIAPLARHAKTLEAMIQHRDPAAALSARALAANSFSLYNDMVGLPRVAVATPTPTPEATAAPVAAATARPAPRPTRGPAGRSLDEARVQAVQMQAWLEKEKYRNAWKSMRQLRYALGAAHQAADPALAEALAAIDREVLEVQGAPRTQMVARVLIIRKKLDRLAHDAQLGTR